MASHIGSAGSLKRQSGLCWRGGEGQGGGREKEEGRVNVGLGNKETRKVFSAKEDD